MSKLTNIGRPVAKLMRVEITEALEKIGEKYGIAFSLGRITFDDVSFRVTVEAGLTTTPGEPMMAIDFRKHCHKYGFKASDLGRVFTNTRLERFEIVGLKPRNRKYPIIGQDVRTQKQYKFTPTTVRMGLFKEE